MARHQLRWKCTACSATLLAAQVWHHGVAAAYPRRAESRHPTQTPTSITIYSSGFPYVHTPLQAAGAEFPHLPFVHVPGQGLRNELDYQLFAQLVGFDRYGRSMPDLLRELPTPSNREVLDGGREVVLRLKPHLSWSSGVRLTSADIRFGWQAAVAVYCGESAKSCGPIAAVSLDGPAAAILHLKQPDSPVVAEDLPVPLPHSWPGFQGSPVVAARKLKGQALFDRSLWTDGPYRIKSLVQRSNVVDEAVLAPMPYYRAGALPKFRTIQIHFATAPSGAAQAGEVVGNVYTGALHSLLENPGGFRVIVTPSFVAETLKFNVLERTYEGGPNPAVDVRVREALALAIDRQKLIQRVLKVNRVMALRLAAYTPFLAASEGSQMDVSRSINAAWDPLARRFVPYGPRTLADARRLLAQAGYARGLRLQILEWSPQAPDLAAELSEIERSWAAIGVAASKDNRPIFSQNDCDLPMYRGDFEVLLGLASGGPDPDALRPLLDSHFLGRRKQCLTLGGPGADNVSGVHDGVIDRAFQQGAATFVPAQRTRWYRQIQEEVSSKAYIIPLYYLPQIVASDRHVRGVQASPFLRSGEYAWNARQWSYAP